MVVRARLVGGVSVTVSVIEVVILVCVVVAHVIVFMLVLELVAILRLILLMWIFLVLPMIVIPPWRWWPACSDWSSLWWRHGRNSSFLDGSLDADKSRIDLRLVCRIIIILNRQGQRHRHSELCSRRNCYCAWRTRSRGRLVILYLAPGDDSRDRRPWYQIGSRRNRCRRATW